MPDEAKVTRSRSAASAIRRLTALLPLLVVVVISASAAWAAGAPDPDRRSDEPEGQETPGSDQEGSSSSESSNDQSGQSGAENSDDKPSGDQSADSGVRARRISHPRMAATVRPPDGSDVPPAD